MLVPVINKNQEPLMPTNSFRAANWIIQGKATPFFKKGVFCVRLNVEPSGDERQDIALGIDPGSKKEGFTVKSKAHTYLNIQADAVTWVKERVEARRNTRRARRNRTTPCRASRPNRSYLRGERLPPSTKARWQWKLRIISWLKKIFPITHVVVEDIKAKTMGKRNWDVSFSPLEVGKNWFYNQIENLSTKLGFETKALRDELELKKSSNKLSNDFSAHCVDSWVLANSIVGGNIIDNKEVVLIRPLKPYRRQLHYFNKAKNSVRKRYGGTMSLGFKKGSLVKHKKLGVAYVGGNCKGKISLHLMNGTMISNYIDPNDCKFLSFTSFVKVK